MSILPRFRHPRAGGDPGGTPWALGKPGWIPACAGMTNGEGLIRKWNRPSLRQKLESNPESESGPQSKTTLCLSQTRHWRAAFAALTRVFVPPFFAEKNTTCPPDGACRPIALQCVNDSVIPAQAGIQGERPGRWASLAGSPPARG